MRFGEIIVKRSWKGFQYLNYDLLKQNIRSQNFYSLLQCEIEKVDYFFENNPKAQIYEFAAINYIAVLKILKKYNKVNSEYLNVNLEITSFGSTLQNGMLAIDSLQACFCPICFSDSVMSAQLPCSHSVCFECLNNMNSFRISSCPLCRSESTEANRTIDRILKCESTKYHIEKKRRKIKVMTWNICSLTFPLHISFVEFALTLIFTGIFKTSNTYDVPLYISEERIKIQADFIRQSNSDVVLLQEVLNEKTLKYISAFLPEFTPVYCTKKMSGLNVIVYGLCVIFIAGLQFYIFKSMLSVNINSNFLFVVLLFNFWSWRDSTLSAFLCGCVEGQLAILTKHKQMNIQKSFISFKSPSIRSSCSTFLLSLFRQRGFLIYKFKGLEVINTHLPHGIIHFDCWDIIKQYCKNKIVVLGGDFNPLPGSNDDYFMPLREIGLINFESKYVTWNLNEPLTRKTDITPKDMQLDYILHSKGISKTQVLKTKHSDHYALLCEFVPDEYDELIFKFEN